MGMTFGKRLAYAVVKSLASLPAAAIAIGVFYGVCYYAGWDAPGWAYFLAGWIGYNDLYDGLTYKRDDPPL
jgi:hypothetical protein